jgi:hypothetical protein
MGQVRHYMRLWGLRVTPTEPAPSAAAAWRGGGVAYASAGRRELQHIGGLGAGPGYAMKAHILWIRVAMSDRV